MSIKCQSEERKTADMESLLGGIVKKRKGERVEEGAKVYLEPTLCVKKMGKVRPKEHR